MDIDIACLDTSLNIRVSDNGPGVPEHEREQVLSAFYRGAAVIESGSGLGLAIVHNIVQSMAGTIALSSSQPDGSGLTVRIVLPVAPSDQQSRIN